MNIILDNLEESIVIFSEDRIEFINDTFLDLFKAFFSTELEHVKRDKQQIRKRDSFNSAFMNFFRSIFVERDNSYDQIESEQFELQKALLNQPILKVQGYKLKN